jgi:hypothetical protein
MIDPYRGWFAPRSFPLLDPLNRHAKGLRDFLLADGSRFTSPRQQAGSTRALTPGRHGS